MRKEPYLCRSLEERGTLSEARLLSSDGDAAQSGGGARLGPEKFVGDGGAGEDPVQARRWPEHIRVPTKAPVDPLHRAA